MKRQWIMMCVSACLVCCLFVFMPSNVFAADGSAYYANKMFYLYPSGATGTDNADLYASLLCTGFWNAIEDFEYSKATSTNNTSSTCQFTYNTPNDTFSVWAYYKFVIRNTTSHDLIIPTTNIRLKIIPNTNTGTGYMTDMIWLGGDLMPDRVNYSGLTYFSNSPDHAINSNIIVPAHGDRTAVFKVKYQSYAVGGTANNDTTINGFTVSWEYPTIPITPVVVDYGDALVSSYPEYLKWIYFRLNTIYDAILDQAQAGSETVDTGEDTQTQIETIHGEEQTWFTQTETDIEGTGLSTFSFTGDASTGITGVKDQFVQLWNAMGIFNIVPIFALSLKLAATIIRHVPARRNPATSEPAPGREIGFIHDLHNPSKGVIWRQ